MKKALLYGLSAVMLLSLTACGTAQANQPDEPSPTPSAVHTEPPQESPAVTPAPENAVEPLSAGRELTDEELVKEFEGAYEAGKACIELGLDEETAISLELTDLNSGFDFRSDIKKPDNLEYQYMTWRDEAHPEVPPETYVDQNILDDGFEVDIDPETGDVGYWNPNTEEDPLTDGLATTERPAGYDPNFNPSGGNPIVIHPDDPWEGQPEIDFVGDGG